MADTLSRIDDIVERRLRDLGEDPSTETLAGPPPTRPAAPQEPPSGTIAGMNDWLAGVFGTTAELANAALTAFGARIDEPGDPAMKVRAAFEAAGVRLPDPSNTDFWTQVGRNVYPAMLMALGPGRMAPGVRAPGTVPNANPIAEAGRTVVHGSAAYPGTSAAVAGLSLPGSEAGGRVAHAVTEPVGEFLFGAGTPGHRAVAEAGELAGEFVGGMTSTMPFLRATQRFGLPTFGGQPSPRTFYDRATGRTMNEPLMPDVDPRTLTAAAGRFSEEVDNEITRLVSGVTRPGLPAGQASTRFVAGLDELDANYANRERQLWSRIPSNTRIDPTRAWQALHNQRVNDDLITSPASVPEFRDRFNRLVEIRNVRPRPPPGLAWATNQMPLPRPDLPENAVIGLRPIPLRLMLLFRSHALRQSREAGGSVVTGRQPDERLQGHLGGFQGAVLDDIGNALPNDQSIQIARDFSRTYQDRFYRGPIGELMMRDAQGVRRVREDAAIEHLLGRPGGMEAVLTAGTAVPGGTRPMAMSNVVVDRADEATLAQWRGVAEDAAERVRGLNAHRGPQEAAAAGNRFLLQIEPEIQGFALASTRLRTTTDQMMALVNERRAVESLALTSRLQGRDPEAIMRSLLSSGNVTESARLLRNLVGNDPQALGGLRNAFLNHILRQYENDMPSLLRQISRQGNVTGSDVTREQARDMAFAIRAQEGTPIHRAMAEIFDPAEVRRFTNIIQTAANLQGQVPLSRRMAAAGASFLEMLSALWAGRGVSHVLGSGSAGSLAWPAYFRRRFQGLLSDQFTANSPGQIISAAVRYPEVERWLTQRVPANLPDAERLYRNNIRLIRRFSGPLTGVAEEVSIPTLSGE